MTLGDLVMLKTRRMAIGKSRMTGVADHCESLKYTFLCDIILNILYLKLKWLVFIDLDDLMS